MTFTQAILYRGARFDAVWPEFLIVALIWAVFLVLGLLRFRSATAAEAGWRRL